ncbi:hypothetical protein QFC22_002253 [Naganishia vaughanmartiniae]|uniref:Uncharacterized protein n=1 Tax=Naganishia vaughanmartiniae TaxID=1424756 RepID=A0ACC2XCU4_9TREE|nr:hypothetical protein QFC22_002253 [Naganishia vaughanmartiniae]
MASRAEGEGNMELDHDNAYYEAEGVQPEDEEYITSTGESSSQTSTLTWITWFTTLPGHDYYCEVEESYIEDDFNLTGLSAQVPFWKEALEMVLDVEPGMYACGIIAGEITDSQGHRIEESSLTIPDVSIIESSAELLYGLVHQRYIITKAGLQAMLEKYESGSFGNCPRYNCLSTYVLPCGRSDQPGLDTVKLYCPNCNDIYTPPSSKYQNVDGAFFGTSFPTLFFQTYPDFLSVPFKWHDNADKPSGSDLTDPTAFDYQTASFPRNPNPYGGTRAPAGKVYEPRIYGFKVSERARSGPRMGWLRDRPVTHAELDKVDWKGRWIGDGPFAPSSSSGGAFGPPGKTYEGGAPGVANVERPKVGKGKLFEEEELKENDEEDVSEEEEVKGTTPAVAAAPAL